VFYTFHAKHGASVAIVREKAGMSRVRRGLLKRDFELSSKKLIVQVLAESTDETVLQVPRALIVSGLAAALDYGVMALLIEAGWYWLVATAIGYLLGGVVQYVLCAVWVFPAAPKSATLGFTAFTILSLVGLVVTCATMAVLYDLGHLHYGFAKIAALGLAFCWNFLSRKYWLFKSDTPQECAT